MVHAMKVTLSSSSEAEVRKMEDFISLTAAKTESLDYRLVPRNEITERYLFFDSRVSRSIFIRSLEQLDYVSSVSNVTLENLTLKFEPTSSRKKRAKKIGPCEKRKEYKANLRSSRNLVDAIRKEANRLQECVNESDDDHELNPAEVIDRAKDLNQEIERAMSRRSLSGTFQCFDSSREVEKTRVEKAREETLTIGEQTKGKVEQILRDASHLQQEYATIMEQCIRA